MAIPVISDLPPAPTRSDGPGDFTSKADAMIGALQPLVLQINIATQWMAGQLTEAQAQAAAAAASAGAAADSAAAANASKLAAAQSASDATTNGAAQVALAAAQVTLAQQARDSAQVAAAAAQSAAGLPSMLGNALKVLRVNSGATGVEWGLGLPLLPGASGGPGKVLTIAAGGTTLQWAELFKIGDIFTSARNPGALWLPADGSIRAQSSYPALFAELGLIGNNIGSVWQTTSNPLSNPSVTSGANGTTIAITGAGLISRSTDRGQTWSAATDISIANPQRTITDGKGTWIVLTSSINGVAKRSTDDGLTWSNINMPGTSAGGWSKGCYAGGTTFLAIRSNYADTVAAISTNGGLTWTTFAHGFGSVSVQDIASDEAGTVIMIAGNIIKRSSDFGQTFTTLAGTGISASLGVVGTDKLGTWIVSGNNANTSLYVSVNNGLGFTLTPLGTTGAPAGILNADAGLVVLFASTTQYIYKSGIISNFTSPNALSGNSSSPGGNVLITLGGTQRALPYIYDTSTQFQLPAMPVVPGVKSYIKALEVAA